MKIMILGSAAGGAFPQWNCGCPNCNGMRDGTLHARPRTQTQVAVSSDGIDWFLLGASPDLRAQIESSLALHPARGSRSSPVAGVVLASADLDHVLGLLLLRELQAYVVYGTASVLRILREDNSMFRMLNRAPSQVKWLEVRAHAVFSLISAVGTDSGLTCELIPLGTRYPAYVQRHTSASLAPKDALTGIIVRSAAGQELAYMPSVSQIDDSLMARLESVDVILFDGTFWSEDELVRVLGSGPTATEMGHLPVGGPSGSLRRLSFNNCGARRIYLHMNNTNPMLDDTSPEFRAICDSGWEVAEDGWEMIL